MKWFKIGFLLTGVLANITEEANNELPDYENYNITRMAELTLEQDAGLKNRQSLMAGPQTVISDIAKIFTLKVLLDLYKMFLQTPPKLLFQPRNIAHGSIQEVRDHLAHSLLAICPAQKILGFQCICDKTYKHITVHEDRGMEALAAVAVHPVQKTIIVSYRPTLTIKNWITDADYEWVDYPDAPKGTRVHSGFYSHFLSTQKASQEAVIKLLGNPDLRNYDLLVSGYSLGSALAILSLPHWSQILKSRNDTRKLHSFVYAGPRVGNEQFAQYITSLNIPLTRYTNRNDIVSHVPPRTYGFVHVGAEIHEHQPHIFAKPELKVCSQHYDEDPQCGYRNRVLLSAVRHILPLDRFLPIPPYC
uniref:Putative triacylglycerol lipase n=1 Tax=Pandora neoaphidis TaxID=76017 RepID=E2EYZ6_9FUNG|nr:putative triacylglycerol lipase precursor [Pandora neoaphidis]